MKKDKATETSHKANRKLVESLLRQHALRTVLGPGHAQNPPAVPPRVAKPKQDDMYILPPEPDRER